MSNDNSNERENRREEIQEQLHMEVERLTERASRSIDPAVVAKAVAVSDEDIQNKLLERLESGQKLKSVNVLRDTQKQSSWDRDILRRVCFEFELSDNEIGLSQDSVLAVTNVTKGTVTEIDDSYQLGEGEGRMNAHPFAVAVPSHARTVTTDLGKISRIRDRDRDWLENVGISWPPDQYNPFGSASPSPTTDCIVPRVSWSGDPSIPDDEYHEVWRNDD